MYLYIKNYFQNISSFNGSSVTKFLKQLDEKQIKEIQLLANEKHVNIREYICMVVNNIKNLNKCKICGKELTYLQTRNNKQYCSKKCLGQDKEYQLIKHLKIKNTCIKKYGVDNPQKVKFIRQKTKNTCILKYGGVAPLCNDLIKNKIDKNKTFANELFRNKAKEKFTLKYKVDNPQKVKEIKEKTKNTCILKYGGSLNQANKQLWKKYYLSFSKYKDYVIPLFKEEEYLNNNYKPLWKCVKCGLEFEFILHDKNNFIEKFPYIPKCPKCYSTKNKGYSQYETRIRDFIKLIYNGLIIENDRKIIKPYLLDIVLPLLKLAIEINGDYWHCTRFERMTPDFHLMKTLKCLLKGYRLIHIFVSEIYYKEDIVKQKLKSIICNNLPSIYARNCLIKLIDNKTKDLFLNNYHIQGKDNSKVKIGLFNNDLLIAVMTFCKPRFTKKYLWLLSRYATSKRVIGGAGKLLDYFLKTYNSKSIITYCDRRFSIGNMYLKIGFKLDHISKPNYWYYSTKKIMLLTRYQCQKHKLKKLLGEDIFDPNLSEEENMKKIGGYRVYDCGNLVYVKERL